MTLTTIVESGDRRILFPCEVLKGCALQKLRAVTRTSSYRRVLIAGRQLWSNHFRYIKLIVYFLQQHPEQLVFDENYLVHHMYSPNYTVICTEPQDNDMLQTESREATSIMKPQIALILKKLLLHTWSSRTFKLVYHRQVPLGRRVPPTLSSAII